MTDYFSPAAMLTCTGRPPFRSDLQSAFQDLDLTGPLDAPCFSPSGSHLWFRDSVIAPLVILDRRLG